MSIQPAQYHHSISPGKECLVFVYQPHIQTGCVPTKPAEANVQFHKNCQYIDKFFDSFGIIFDSSTDVFLLLFIWRTFNSSRSHGTPALSAIERYSEISELVNRSLDLVEQANNTINMIYQQVSVNVV